MKILRKKVFSASEQRPSLRDRIKAAKRTYKECSEFYNSKDPKDLHYWQSRADILRDDEIVRDNKGNYYVANRQLGGLKGVRLGDGTKSEAKEAFRRVRREYKGLRDAAKGKPGRIIFNNTIDSFKNGY